MQASNEMAKRTDEMLENKKKVFKKNEIIPAVLRVAAALMEVLSFIVESSVRIVRNP
jgi:hypothetical protein